ncbi:MAG: hypothetical protein EAZ89_12405 [Bacteroidetes bacterium]|nr:MAG: hypothetical protein EAZ89_12405 [Bacteroidota bacterium]
MRNFRPITTPAGAMNYPGASASAPMARPATARSGNQRSLLLIGGLILVTNFLTHTFLNPNLSLFGSRKQKEIPAGESLYLIEKASMFVPDATSFEKKVRDIAQMLDVPPEWLMSVMYSESKFDASVINLKGSGATGLIQFMPATASDMNVSLERLRRMNHLQQLEYVYLYLQQVKDRYGNFSTLTDLYLGILFPRAMNQDYCFTLYAKPSVAYEQNAGLDENKDGRVTVSDVDKRMQRLYPDAYNIQLPGATAAR